MLKALLLSLLTGLIWAAVGAIFGKAPGDRKKLISFFAVYSVIYCFSSLLLIPAQKTGWGEMMKLAAVMIPASAADLTGFWLLKKVMDSGPQSIAWAGIQSAMILPFLGGMFLPGVHTTWFGWTGVLFMLTGLALLAKGKKSTAKEKAAGEKRFWLILGCAFLMTGTAQFLRLLPNYMSLSPAVLGWRITLGAFVALITWNGIAGMTAGYDLKGIWKTALLYGVVVLCGQYTFYLAADAAAKCGWSSAVYPAAVGTCILLFSVYRVFFKKEKLSLHGWLGILFIICGIAGLSAKK